MCFLLIEKMADLRPVFRSKSFAEDCVSSVLYVVRTETRYKSVISTELFGERPPYPASLYEPSELSVLINTATGFHQYRTLR